MPADTPPEAARTVYEPAWKLAVNVGGTATPLALVSTVGVSANVPLGPVAGAVKVTVAPGSGWPPSVTTALSGPNAVPAAACCPPDGEVMPNARASTEPMSAPVAGRATPRWSVVANALPRSRAGLPGVGTWTGVAPPRGMSGLSSGSIGAAGVPTRSDVANPLAPEPTPIRLDPWLVTAPETSGVSEPALPATMELPSPKLPPAL